MSFTSTGHRPEDVAEAQAWLQRAFTNAKAARVLVEHDDPELLIEAVTQVQQACEKAIKAILLAYGVPYDEVTAMGHNAIGAYVKLIAQMMDSSVFAKDAALALLKEDATPAANSLVKMVLSGRRNRRDRKDVEYAFKRILPTGQSRLGNKALEVEDWRSLTRAFPPKVVEMYITFHEHFADMWRQYINDIPNAYVDPRPLLAGEVQLEAWVFSPSYAGLARRFPGQESDSKTNPIMANLAQQMLNNFVEGDRGHTDPGQWPSVINIREIMLHMSDWLAALNWLFLCAIVTTPHAVSSRYPAEEGLVNNEIGSQDYDRKLGVVACIGPLANHTETVVQNLITHFRQIEEGYYQMLR